jgi:integrase/recombinase XerD
MRTIIVKRELYRGERWLTLSFKYDPDLIAAIKKIDGARWSISMKCWHIPDKPDIVQDLFILLNGKAFLDYSSLNHGKKSEPVHKAANLSPLSELRAEDRTKIEDFRKWMVHRRYSDSTINIYIAMLGHFLRFIKPKENSEINNDDMVRFVNEYVISRGLSYTFQNQVISATKLFFRHVYKVDFEVENFERPRREHRLPNVLSKEEIKAILQAPSNLKHKAMLSLIYACGLRRSELLNLRPADIDS